MFTENIAIMIEASKPIKETIIRDYKNGGMSINVNGHYRFIRYNTGDEIWLEFHDKYEVVKIRTFDGLYWEKGMPSLSGKTA